MSVAFLWIYIYNMQKWYVFLIIGFGGGVCVCVCVRAKKGINVNRTWKWEYLFIVLLWIWIVGYMLCVIPNTHTYTYLKIYYFINYYYRRVIKMALARVNKVTPLAWSLRNKKKEENSNAFHYFSRFSSKYFFRMSTWRADNSGFKNQQNVTGLDLFELERVRFFRFEHLYFTMLSKHLQAEGLK